MVQPPSGPQDPQQGWQEWLGGQPSRPAGYGSQQRQQGYAAPQTFGPAQGFGPQPGYPAARGFPTQQTFGPQPGYGAPAAFAPPFGPPSPRNYQQPIWTAEWQDRRPRKAASAIVAGVVAVLVAAIVSTIVLVTKSDSTATPAGNVPPPSQQQSQLPPTPPPTASSRSTPDQQTTGQQPTDQLDPTDSQPTDRPGPIQSQPTDQPDPTESQPTGRQPTSKAPAPPMTTSDDTSSPTTSNTKGTADDTYIQDNQQASKAAGAWATAVSKGDFAAVRAVSCSQDIANYASGAWTNPASLAGKYTITFESAVTARPKAIAFFTVTPAVKGDPSMRLLMAYQHSKWSVCFTVETL